ncbi:hypothetical protein B0I31_10987 [Saccharothrix carnea]|uniref:Uncharacterized protein n=1 Tax=Saccharothrix carnea TaxID=1280637 RepID=A0A2P8I4A4_SACCR|nr:hypothetical protein [Saccharothrix carnea]PSL53297.1 hypothetical protein B0I31_10987 [Saccharothrix carnea]
MSANGHHPPDPDDPTGPHCLGPATTAAAHAGVDSPAREGRWQR